MHGDVDSVRASRIHADAATGSYFVSSHQRRRAARPRDCDGPGASGPRTLEGDRSRTRGASWKRANGRRQAVTPLHEGCSFGGAACRSGRKTLSKILRCQAWARRDGPGASYRQGNVLSVRRLHRRSGQSIGWIPEHGKSFGQSARARYCRGSARNYETHQVFYPSKDGTRVSMFLVTARA